MTTFTHDIPSEDDWGDYSKDFDVADAHRSFYGKSNEDAQVLFAKDVLARAQDIRFMPPTPFLYYIQGFCDFVMSGQYGNSRSWDVGGGFLSVIESWVETSPQLVAIDFRKIDATLDYILKNEDGLGLDIDIYGDIGKRCAAIRGLIANRSIGDKSDSD